MAEEAVDVKPDAVNTALGDMKLEEGASLSVRTPGQSTPTMNEGKPGANGMKRSASMSPIKRESASATPQLEGEEEIIPQSVVVEEEPGKPPKLSRKPSQKVVARSPPLFDHIEDSTEEATSHFQVIHNCIYGSKSMGASEHDALGCDCSGSWENGENHACGEDSDCINRATKIECIDDECNCGPACQNQRFQRKQYAKVSVIKTEKKGYGLRADVALQPNDFIFEYIGEVINEPTFRRRMIQYDEEGIKHFYFMSLNKNEFVDATKKGNLGRFCNHSCNPNCYVDKWVVGEKLRMGIFAERHVKAGEELVFNYNVDRYGADPQPCYCNEPNCMGYIGGKTQTERATKLSHTTLEALGIDDGDGWDTTVARKPRKKKAGEDDEEYVSSLQAKSLHEDGVTKVMATLMQCKEKWIVVKLLARIQRCNDDKVRNQVIRMHGYQILRTVLTTFIEDNNVVLQVLNILDKFPRLTRNKISDSNIEAVVETLKSSEHLDIAEESSRLLEEWSKLETAYRIPRKKFDPTTASAYQDERRDAAIKEETRRSPSPPIAAPTGPRNAVPQRKFFQSSRPPRRNFGSLPPGWFSAVDQSGRTYYYDKSGQTTWQRPFRPAVEAPPMPRVQPKAVAHQKALQDIIDNITRQEMTPKTAVTPPAEPPVKKEKKSSGAKWRSLPEEKQMKVYENTLFPHIKYVMDKFKHKLPRDDLKKFAKEISKKIVASDYKNRRVEDPTIISPKHEKNVKKHVKEYFDKAVAKKAAHEERKAKRKEEVKDGAAEPTVSVEADEVETPLDEMDLKPDDFDDSYLSGDEGDVNGEKSASVPDTPSDEGLKRKLAEMEDVTTVESPNKRTKDYESAESSPAPPPPPPPPPPADESPMDVDPEEEELRKQEEELMRENEEALIKENEEALRDEEMKKGQAQLNGDAAKEHSNLINGGSNGPTENSPKSAAEEHVDASLQHERKEVLSH